MGNGLQSIVEITIIAGVILWVYSIKIQRYGLDYGPFFFCNVMPFTVNICQQNKMCNKIVEIKDYFIVACPTWQIYWTLFEILNGTSQPLYVYGEERRPVCCSLHDATLHHFLVQVLYVVHSTEGMEETRYATKRTKFLQRNDMDTLKK